MLEPLIPAAEHTQLATTEQIEHHYSCHMTFRLTPLPRLDNMLPVVLQLNVRCRSRSSSHARVCRVYHSPGLSVFSGIGRMAAKVILLLLILSGDIETNPGPVGQEDLRNLHCELHPVSYKWYCLGVQLYVPIGTLKCIESDCAKVSDCLLEMLSTWVKSTNPPPTWEALAKALESPPVGERTLAQQLRDKYCRGGEEVIPHIHPTPRPSFPGAPPTSQGPPSSPVIGILRTPRPATVTTPAHQPGPSAPVQRHPQSREASPKERLHFNTVCCWYSQPQPEHPPVQQYAHLSHTNTKALAPSSVDHTHLTPISTNESQIQLSTPNYHQDSSLMYVGPSQYRAGHTTQLPPPIPLSVPPSQFNLNSISNMHFPVHSERTRQSLNPAFPHPASQTDQLQDTHGIPRHGYHHQYPTSLLPPSSTSLRMQSVPAPLFQPHQGRSATDDHHYSHAVQSGQGPSYLAQLYPSTPQYLIPHNTQCDPQPLPVLPSQCYWESSTSNEHLAVHPQPVCRPLNSVSSHVPVPIPTPPPHQGRSAADYHPHTPAVQPGHTPPSLRTHPSTLQHYCHSYPSPNHQTSSLHFQPCATHSLSPTEISSQVHVGEHDVPPAAKRPCYTRSSHVPPCTTLAASHSISSSLSPAMAKYARYLRACYTRSPLPENSKFPPSPSNYYINLACISRRTMSKHESEVFKLAMVRGEIDEIARDEGVDFSEVAKRLPSGSYPQVVVVEGAPGVGKTTFAWEFCSKWGKSELKQEYLLVILLRLRDKRIQEAKCLRDLFYHPDETLPDVIAAELINSLGEGVLVLLEGLDELPEHQRTESSVFLDLIHGRLLPLATVLITTRPWASEYLHISCKEKISQHIEILGFTKQQIENYLQSVCSPSLHTDIEKYLSCYPQIHAAMYIPLNAAIVVEVYRRSRSGDCIVTKTMTQLYTALSHTLLSRYLKEHPVHKEIKWKIHDFSVLPSDVYKHFLQLSKVAYDSIKNNQKLIFSSEDLPDSLDTLGFMQSVPELYVNESFSHNFLHLTIQEYLAAVYIAQLSPEEQLEHFKESGATRFLKFGLFEVVMKFVAGLSKFSVLPLNSQRDLFLEPLNDSIHKYHVKCKYTVISDRVNWMFETQDPNTINTILGSGNTIRFVCQYFMPFDYYCLGYCIAHSHCQWELLFNEEVGMTEEDVKMLTVGGSALPLSQQNSSIVSMDCWLCTHEAMVYLFNTLPLHIRVELQELTGGGCDLSGQIRIVMSSPSLKVFDMYTDICVEDLNELCGLLASTSNSLEIIIIENETCQSNVIIEGRCKHTSVSVKVRISSMDDFTSAVSVLSENSNLGLHITAVTVDMFFDRACQIANALHDTTTLKVLNVYCKTYPIEMEGVLAIAKLINNNKSLEYVEVSSGCWHFSLKKLYWRHIITVGEFRELCGHLLASTSNSLEIIKITKLCEAGILIRIGMSGYGYDDDWSYMTIEGRYQNTSVSVDVHISSVDDITSAVSVLTKNSNLGLHVTAIRMHMDSDQVCHIAKALHDTTTLEVLKAFDDVTNPNGIKGVLSIAKLINNNKSLEDVEVRLGYLQLSLKELYWWCAITVGEFRELCDYLLASTSNSLESIKITKYYDGDQSFMTVEGRYQHTSVSVNTHISSVDDVTCTVSVLTGNSNLGLHITAIRMWKLCESIDGDLACQLAKVLHDTTLKRLEMFDHPIGAKGAIAIVKLIHSNKSLEEVDVSSCSIDSEGVCHLARELCENTTLRNLNLSDNPIGQEGAISLAAILHTNTSLQTLELSHCAPLGEDGTHKLLEAMTVNSTLQHLILPEECLKYARKFLSEVWSRVSFFSCSSSITVTGPVRE